jgi:photosystem II stability/assembly factor-like uncharacterized protein
MMQRSRFFSLLIPVCAFVLLGQGCSGTSTATNTADGGVYKTPDRGTTWVQKRILVKEAKTYTLGNDPITSLALDPQDRMAVYGGTTERGIILSLNGGDTWEEMTKGPKGARIESIAVDPKEKCTIYAAMKNKLYKTTNCGRDWAEMFFDPNVLKIFTTIVVDWYNPTILYAGTSEGDVFRSTDAGLSWLVSTRSTSPITDILVDLRDSRIVYVATGGEGLRKTMDGGNTWMPIVNQLKDFSNAKRVNRLAMDNAQTPTLYMASKFGILASQDGGTTWNALKLTSEAGEIDILDLAVNPRSEKEIEYITKTAVVFSSDKGTTWIAKRLPSSRPATVLMADPQDGNVIYLGFGAPPK